MEEILRLKFANLENRMQAVEHELQVSYEAVTKLSQLVYVHDALLPRAQRHNGTNQDPHLEVFEEDGA